MLLVMVKCMKNLKQEQKPIFTKKKLQELLLIMWNHQLLTERGRKIL